MREVVKWQHVLIIVGASHCLLAESDLAIKSSKTWAPGKAAQNVNSRLNLEVAN